MERKISRKGGITIPSNMRRELGISGGEKVELSMLPDGDLHLSRITGSCLFCGGKEHLAKLEGRYVCRGCITELYATCIVREKETICSLEMEESK